MTEAPSRMPRQPKIRSSCDPCGAAKLKCDRVRPQCGRCFSLDLTCIYGVSRKMGKPPRERPRISEGSRVSHTPSEQVGGIDRDTLDNNSYSGGTMGSIGDGTVLSSELFPTLNDTSSTWGAVEGYPNSLITSIVTSDVLHSDLLGPSLPDSTPLGFGDDLLSTLASPDLEFYSTPAAQTKASQTQVDESTCSESALMPLGGSKGHDCSREAHDILGSLSFLKTRNAYSTPQSPPGSTTASPANRVPLDHVLYLTREASERIGRLLTCSCARSPHLALLYASIISRILTWYQQAAGHTQSALCGSTATTLDTVSPSSGPGSEGGSSTWSSTAASTCGTTSTPALTQSTRLAVTPAKMAIGTFNVDDLRVQTALEIQLLSGELRRAGDLIDQFTLHQSNGQCLTDEYTFGGVNDLYQSLDSWLRAEHSRIANMIRSKLRELNT